jgi:hypothetical protein
MRYKKTFVFAFLGLGFYERWVWIGLGTLLVANGEDGISGAGLSFPRLSRIPSRIIPPGCFFLPQS